MGSPTPGTGAGRRAPVAQGTEQLPSKQRVVCSNRTGGADRNRNHGRRGLVQPSRLSRSQQERFASGGALILKGALAAEIPALEDAFERVFAAWTGPAGQRAAMTGFLDRDPVLSGLRSHGLINRLQASLVPGKSLVQAASTGNLHSGDNPWHVDGVGNHAIHVRINIYLDPVAVGRGCLLVVPGSHRFGPRQAVPAPGPIVPLPGWYDPAGSWIGLESEPGDVIVIDRRLIHASLGGGRRRRMFNLDLKEG